MSARIVLPSLVAIACIAAVVMLAGCTGPAATTVPTPVPTTGTTETPVPAGSASFNETNSGGTYPLSIGAVIQIRLRENPTTGYTWNLSVTRGLSVINDTYIPDDVTGKLVGSGGTHVWFLEANQPGQQVLSGVYRRPWESAKPGMAFFNLTLVIGESTCGEKACTVPSTPPAVPPGYPVYTESDNGKTVKEPLGETFALRLQENPTTGYSWNLSLPKGLTLSRDEYIPSSTGGQLVGGGGVRSFTLVAVEKGEQILSAEYRRPWIPAGTVIRVDLEGGFYGILGDDGKKYDPLNLDLKFQKDGLRVAFDSIPAKDAVGTKMWGTPVELVDIKEIHGFSLTVQVT
jgi:inhibitor of cysteine peptidase